MAANRLDKAGAHRRAQRARDCMMTVAEAIDTLIDIQERQDWLALGYKSWPEYCEKEFGPDRLTLSPEQRGQVVAVLVASGMPKRRVAAALGVTEGTVRNDVKKSRARAPEVRNDYALPAGAPQVKDPLSEFPAAERAVNDFIGNQTAAGRANDTPADGDPSTAETSEEAPAAGTGADPLGEADRPVPAVNPEYSPASAEPGTADDAPTSSAATPPAAGPGPAQGDETEPEESAFPASPGTVDGQEQQDLAGVSGPAAPGPDQPAELIEWFAARFEQVDADVSGPLLGSEGLDRIAVAARRVVFVVELLTKWHERTQT